MQKFKYIKKSELKMYRKKWHNAQKMICPILKQEVPFEKTSIVHMHKRRSDKLGGEGNLGLIRGVIHVQANSLEGVIVNNFKRYGLNKFINLPTFLRNLADYIEAPPLLNLNVVHPSELERPEKIKKREFNKLKKHYFDIYPNRRKLPKFPKNGRITKVLSHDFEKLREYLNGK